jgi:regulator of replication initiation timing
VRSQPCLGSALIEPFMIFYRPRLENTIRGVALRAVHLAPPLTDANAVHEIGEVPRRCLAAVHGILQERINELTQDLEGLKREVATARAEVNSANEERRATQHRLDVCARDAEQARQQATQAAIDAAAATAKAATELQLTQRRLEQVQAELAAASITLPPLIDLEGDPGVPLGDAAFDAVTLHDGIVEVHRLGQPIPLGDATTDSLAQATALATALLAVHAAGTARSADDD